MSVYLGSNLVGITIPGSGGGGGGSVTQDAQGYIVLPSTGGGGGATQHTIHLEFSDSTDTDIDVYYDDSLIGTMITNYAPAGWTYNNKLISLAQLDNVTWYEPSNIPLNTELVDLSKITYDVAIQNDGTIAAAQYYSVTDYIVIDPNMTFSFKCGRWQNCAYYDTSRTFISIWNAYSAGASVDPNDSNVSYGTFGGNGFTIPSNAAYIRLSAGYMPSNNDGVSLIRTA